MTTSYMYNALGQRIQKANAAGSTLFAYDEQGHLIGEYDQNGLVQELVWLDDIPVATLRTDQGGTNTGLFYIHTDHLKAPTKITRTTNNEVIWRWDHDPYGNGTPNEDPDGNGLTLSMNLRFPGQYLDQETGLLYNWNRYLDPATGRYVESDPIGLLGGINTYAYVRGNPVSRIDPTGLACVGLNCYTTPAEAAAAQSGNYGGYYQLACAGGDAYACFAGHVAANDSFMGHVANKRLRDFMKDKADKSQQCLDEDGIMDKIRKDLAKRYADSLPNNPRDARQPSRKDVAQFHWDVFGQFGLPPSTFGGTPYGPDGPPVPLPGFDGPYALPGTWCPNCSR